MRVVYSSRLTSPRREENRRLYYKKKKIVLAKSGEQNKFPIKSETDEVRGRFGGIHRPSPGFFGLWELEIKVSGDKVDQP